MGRLLICRLVCHVFEISEWLDELFGARVNRNRHVIKRPHHAVSKQKPPIDLLEILI
jgi:hypothetical protein